MTSKRTPRGRPSKPRITAEAVRLFVRSEELAPIRDACISDDICRTKQPNQHCPECGEYIDAVNELGRLLGIEVWQASPVEADGPEPPSHVHNNPLMATGWRRSWELRCALVDAAKQLGAGTSERNDKQ
jgi:hypothetical protein